jgi:hypothetical protein
MAGLGTTNHRTIEDGMRTFTILRNFISRFRGRAKSSATLLGLTFVLASCGGSASGGGGSGVPTATLTATPPTITVGQNADLTFSSTNATSGTIDNGVGPVGIVSQGSGVAVSPTVTTIYHYTVNGPGGSATAMVTVTVNAAPTVTLFTASPMSVNQGQSTTLTVQASNATQLVIKDNIPQDTPYTLPSPTGGTETVTPQVTTVYTATATGVNGSTATQTVTVTELPPTVAFNAASTTTILAGQSTTLTWTSTNATSLVIDNGIGNEFLNGSLAVTPATTTTYTITATGSGGVATATAKVTVNPINSFEGLSATQVEGGTTEDDIDPNGAVGITQFMEYVNTSYQGFGKTPPYAPVWPTPQQINTPWPRNSPCAQVTQSGPAIQLDSVIIYDRLASRWVIAAKTTVQDDYNFCIAVSNMDNLADPGFAWYAYSWNLDNNLGKNAGGHFYQPDWPKLGTWPDGYYAAMDLVDPTTKVESGMLACAFDRTSMLSNSTPTPAFACYKDQNVARMSNGIYLAHSLIPADVDGTTPPPAGRDEFMVSIENPLNPFGSDGQNSSTTLNLWDFHVDWTPPATLTLESLTSPTVSTYIPGCYTQAAPGQTICVPEPGVSGFGGIKVDSVGDRFMPRFAYRNFGTGQYESFLISHTVQTNLGSGQDLQQTGIRWYELRASGSGTPTLSQENTISPDSVLFRFLPSIAQDKNGNAAVGYNFSNTSNNPGINLSFWNLNPIDANPPTEVTILNGPGEEIPFVPSTGVLTNVGQWGSYATISVDPVDDCTFWYVNEYWPTTVLTGEPASWATNISNFQIPGCQ